MNNHRIRKIMITEEALTDLEKMINNAKKDGLEDVTAQYDEVSGRFEFEMKYSSKEREGEFFTRTITINLENP